MRVPGDASLLRSSALGPTPDLVRLAVPVRSLLHPSQPAAQMFHLVAPRLERWEIAGLGIGMGKQLSDEDVRGDTSPWQGEHPDRIVDSLPPAGDHFC